MSRRKRGYLEALICILLLFVLPLFISASAFLRGETPLKMSRLASLPPWQEACDQNDALSAQTEQTGLINRYYPWYVFLHEAGHRRELPLWNPYEGLGAPFLAAWRTRVLSPFSVPFYLFPLASALAVSLFLKMIIAGLGAYYAARRFQFTPPFSLLVAITYQMSGALFPGYWHPLSDVIPWLPFLLPGLQKLLLGEKRVWPKMALLIGLMTLGGDPETLAGILTFLLVCIPVYCARTYHFSHFTRSTILFLFSIVAGFALAAVQLLPYIEFLKVGKISGATAVPFRLQDLSNILVPMASPNTPGAAWWLPQTCVALLLIPLWLSVRPYAGRIRKRRLESLLFSSLTTFVLAFFLVPQLSRLSMLPWLEVHHFMAPLALSLGFLCATAMDEWVHLDADKCKSVLRKLLWILPVFWAMAFIITAVILFQNKSLAEASSALYATVGVALAVLILLAVTLLWPRPAFSAYVLACITFLLLWNVYKPLEHFSAQDAAFPRTHFISAIKNQKCRVAGTEQLDLWPLSCHAIPQAYSPAGIRLNRSDLFLQQAAQKPELHRLAAASALLLTKEDIQGRYASLRPLLNVKEVFPSGAILLTDLRSLPRARIAHAGRALESDKEPVLRVSGPPLFEKSILPPGITGTPTAQATITNETLNRITVHVETDMPGVLILADSWCPGWKAEINGAEVEVFPVDIAFRGVEIGAGSCDIHFTYTPDSLRIGAYISAGALIIMLLAMRPLHFLRHWRRQ